jgi:hypothetical protein
MADSLGPARRRSWPSGGLADPRRATPPPVATCRRRRAPDRRDRYRLGLPDRAGPPLRRTGARPAGARHEGRARPRAAALGPGRAGEDHQGEEPAPGPRGCGQCQGPAPLLAPDRDARPGLPPLPGHHRPRVLPAAHRRAARHEIPRRAGRCGSGRRSKGGGTRRST